MVLCAPTMAKTGELITGLTDGPMSTWKHRAVEIRAKDLFWLPNLASFTI